MTSTLLNHPLTEAPPDDVTAARDGDREAFGRLYARYYDTVFRYAYFRVGRRSVAEDIAQDTFIRALRRVETFVWTGKDIGAWLVTITRNLTADYFKSGYYRLELQTEDTGSLMRPGGGNLDVADVAETCLDGFRDAWVRGLVARLNSEQHECITLRFFKGLSVAETATVMGKNEGAIKALQYRATRALYRMTQEAGNPLRGNPLP